MRKCSCIILVLLLTASILFTGCGSSTSEGGSVEGDSNQESEVLTIRYSASSSMAAGTPGDNMRKNFIEYIEEYSNGSIVVEEYAPGSVISTEREATEAIQLGTLDMTSISDMGIDGVIGGLGWAWLPYMITNYEDADDYYVNGWIGEELTRQMEDSSVIRIAPYENDFRVLGVIDHPIHSLSDFDGVKIRVPEIEQLLRFYELAGGLSVTIAASETLTALEQGTIEGVDNSMLNLQGLGLLPSMDYIIVLNHMYSAGSWVANPTWWNGLTDDQREIITKACTDIGQINFQESRAQNESMLGEEGQEEYGYEVLYVSDELDGDLNKIGVQIWEEFGDEYRKDLIERVIQDFGR